MTVLGQAGEPTEVDGRPWAGRVRARWVALVLVAAAVLVGLWQWRSPAAFGDPGSEVAMYSPVGTTALFGVATPHRDMDPAVLTLHAASPRVTEGDAEVDVLVCRPRWGAGGIGAARSEAALDRLCEHTLPAVGTQMIPGDDLILRVRSEAPGRVVVDGIEVTYAHGWRRGSQVTGLTVEATFGTEAVREHLAGK